MSPRDSLLSGLLIFSCNMPLGADVSANPSADDERDVRAIARDIEAATNERDIARLLKWASNDIVLVSKNGAIVAGKTNLGTYLESMIGALPSLRGLHSSLEMHPSILYAGNAAITTGVSRDRYRFADGLDLSITTAWTATIVRAQGEWRISALHFSFNLFANPLLDAARWAAVIMACALFLAGLLSVYAGFRVKHRYAARTTVGSSISIQ